MWITVWINVRAAVGKAAKRRPGLSRDGGGRSGAGCRYFHCVETPNPAAMNPNPARMFQLPQLLTGQSPLVT